MALCSKPKVAVRTPRPIKLTQIPARGANPFRNGGQYANEESRPMGVRGVARGSAPLSKTIMYLMGIKYLISFPCWPKLAYNLHNFFV